MKKRSHQEPSALSLHEMPELDFSKYRLRRNPYAGRIAREGAEVVHDEPSAASLADMPEAVAMQHSAFSSAASRSSKRCTVGLVKRE